MKLLKLPRWVRVPLALAAVYAIWQAWVFLRPRPREYAPAELRAIEAACTRAADVLAKKLTKPARLGVMHAVDDPRDAATAALRAALAAESGFRVEESSVIRKFLSDLYRAAVEATTLEEIIHAGRRVQLDAIVLPRLGAVTRTPDDLAQAEVKLKVYDVRTSAWVLKDTFTAEWRPSLVTRWSERIRHTSRTTRFTLWLAVVLALPWLTAFATRRVLEKKSNAASLGLILVYTALGLVWAAVLSGFSLIGSGAWGLFLAALILGALYSFWACELIAKRES